MTTHVCDVCGTSMADGRISKLPTIAFNLGKDGDMPCVTAEFVAGCGPGLGSWMPQGPKFICQFNTTNISVCSQCVLSAFKKAVAAIE